MKDDVMYDILKQNLHDIITLENKRSVEDIASIIVGELLDDPDDQYEALLENNPTLQRIDGLASDLEISNGSEEELAAMWKSLKKLIANL